MTEWHRMTNYEFASLVSKRTVALNQGLPPFIEVDGNLTHREIAELELRGVPERFGDEYSIKRQYPNGTVEILSVKNMHPPVGI